VSEAARRPPIRIIALEAATEAGGVALLEGSRLLGERTFGESQRSASALLVALDELLRASRCELEEFDLIALSVGPGSFTGLRVGLATALGLCFDTGRRVVPVSTLAALSTHAGKVEHIVPMLDARRGEVYAGLYGPGGHALREDRACDPASFLASLPDEPTPYHFVGTGSLRYAGMIREKLGDSARLLSSDQARPRAASVGLLGVQLASTGVSVAAADVELRYLRKPAAEVAQRAGHFPGESIT
jgi:tRNA threonylcarbamoyladenosine biosynthesis protein TsaB